MNTTKPFIPATSLKIVFLKLLLEISISDSIVVNGTRMMMMMMMI
jgi:hypothetical protein